MPRAHRDDLPLLLTVDQVASILQLHPETIRLQIRQGRLPARKYGKSWRILRDDLFAPTAPQAPSPVRVKSPAGEGSRRGRGLSGTFVTHAEAARMLGCSRATIARMIDRGELPTEAAGAAGGARRVRRDTIIDRLLARQASE